MSDLTGGHYQAGTLAATEFDERTGRGTDRADLEVHCEWGLIWLPAVRNVEQPRRS